MSEIKGQQDFTTDASQFNATDFQIQQALRKINTAEPVRVVSVQPGAVGPVGMVSVQPLVNLVTGTGDGMAQSTLYQLPYLRIQGGENAVIVDPKPGDIGLAVYAMRDTETVKANRDGNAANPGSARMYSKGDGFFLGGFLNATPKRYVMVDDTGITLDDGQGGKLELKGGKLSITAPAGIESTSPTEVHDTPSLVFGNSDGAVATMNADMQINGSVTSTGDQVAGGISQMQHTHTGVQTGSGNTGKPQ